MSDIELRGHDVHVMSVPQPPPVLGSVIRWGLNVGVLVRAEVDAYDDTCALLFMRQVKQTTAYALTSAGATSYRIKGAGEL